MFRSLLPVILVLLSFSAYAQNNEPGDNPKGDIKKNPYTGQYNVVSVQGVSIYGTSGYCWTANGPSSPPTWQACGGGGGGSPGGTLGQVQVNSPLGSFAGITLGGDVSLNYSTGSVTVNSIGGNAVNLGGAFTTSGANALTLTTTGSTNVTLPTSGTLATTANINTALPSATTSQLYGGTGSIGAAQAITLGTNLTMSGSTLNAAVTSVQMGSSLGAPSPFKSGDTTTGFYSSAAGTVSVAIAGVDTVDFNASGVNVSDGNNGGTAFSVDGNPLIQTGKVSLGNPALFIGYQSGQSATMSTINQATCVGSLTCQQMTGSQEATAVGYLALSANNAAGGGNSAFGAGALWHDATGVNMNCFGADTCRDIYGANFSSGFGRRSLSEGSPTASNGFGTYSLRGNASSIIWNTVPTTGAVITVTYTGTYTGSPHSFTYTVVGGDTTTTLLATHVCAAQAADSTLFAQNFSCYTDGGNQMAISFTGSSTAGYAVTTTVSTSDSTGTWTIGGGNNASNNDAFGYQALYGAALTGGNNDAFGAASLFELTTGNNNAAFGFEAGQNLTSGNNNVIMGSTSFLSATTAGNSVSIGYNAGVSTTTANLNTYVGYFAGRFVSTGGINTFVGGQAGVGVTGAKLTGGSNTGLGGSALLAIQGAGNNNVAVGYGAGQTITTANNNTVIGPQVDSSTHTTGTFDLLIGVNNACVVSGAAASNEIHICGQAGDSILVTGANTLATEAMKLRGVITLSDIGSDATHTDSTVCQDTTTHSLYAGSGTLGVCLGTSSVRYKNRINPLDTGLAQIAALKPVAYYYNPDRGDHGARLQYGFLAEDVNGVLPRLTQMDAEGKPNSVDILGMVPVLVKAVQEQQIEIAALKARVTNDNGIKLNIAN